jgi:hypothetical protein
MKSGFKMRSPQNKLKTIFKNQLKQGIFLPPENNIILSKVIKG